MRPLGGAVFFLLLVLGYSPTWALEIPSAEPDTLPSKILHPLPDYDPFEASPSRLQFFPDKVDKRVRDLLIDSLTHRVALIEDHVRFFIHKDPELKEEHGSVTGLTEHAMDFFYNTIREHDLYLAAQKRALASSPSPEQKRLIEWRLQSDALTQADELLKKSRTKRWGAWLNRLLGAVDLLGILSGSYVAAAVETTLSQLLQGGSPEMSLEERKALTLYREHLKRYPDERRREEIQKTVETLEKKRKGVLIEREIEKAKEAEGKENLDGAEFHYEVAAIVDPQSRSAKDGLEGLRKKLQLREEQKKNGLSVAVAPLSENDAAEDSDLGGLLYALTLRDPDAIESQAPAREEKSGLSSFRQARTRHRLQSVRYVLLGNDVVKKNLLLGTTPLVASGPAAVGYVAAANLIMIGSNLFEVLTSNPISHQPILDQGAAYLRRHPDSPSAGEVHTILAQAYEAAGRYDKAIAYHQMSDKVDEKKIAQLKEKAAQGLLQAAEKSAERGTQESCLKWILDDYPESAAAKEATRRLARLAQSENRGLRMSKQFLTENPEFYGPEGLGLKPTLFDGEVNNMELADKGVNVLNQREVLLHFQTPWGIQSRTYPLTEKGKDRFQLALRDKNDGGELSAHRSLGEGEKEEKGFWGTRLALGADERTPFGGLEIPIPVIQGLFPLDLSLQGKPGRLSIFPKIHISMEKIDNEALYR